MELERIAKSAEDLIELNNQSQTGELFEHPLRELLGSDTQFRIIRGSLKVEVAKKVELEEHIAKEQGISKISGVYDDAMKEDIAKQINDLNDELATRQESINVLKGRPQKQITSFKDTSAKVLDSNTSLAEKI